MPRLTSRGDWRNLGMSQRCPRTGANAPRDARTLALPCTTSLVLNCYLIVLELSSWPTRGWRPIVGDVGDSRAVETTSVTVHAKLPETGSIWPPLVIHPCTSTSNITTEMPGGGTDENSLSEVHLSFAALPKSARSCQTSDQCRPYESGNTSSSSLTRPVASPAGEPTSDSMSAFIQILASTNCSIQRGGLGGACSCPRTAARSGTGPAPLPL